MKPITRIMSVCLTAIVLSFAMLSLVGCGPSAEEVVRQGVTTELDQVKSLDSDMINKIASESGVDKLAVYGIDAKTFVTSYLKGFDYRIDDVKVQGDNATATVVLTCKKIDAFTQGLSDAMKALATDKDVTTLSTTDLNAKVGQVVLDVLNKIEPTESNPVDLLFTRTGNVWGPTADAEQALAAAMFSTKG